MVRAGRPEWVEGRKRRDVSDSSKKLDCKMEEGGEAGSRKDTFLSQHDQILTWVGATEWANVHCSFVLQMPPKGQKTVY